MAKMRKDEFFVALLFCCFYAFVCGNTISNTALRKRHVDFALDNHKRDVSAVKMHKIEDISHNTLQQVVSHSRRRRSETGSENDAAVKCHDQEKKFNDTIKNKENLFLSIHNFTNKDNVGESKASMAVIWTGLQTGTILVSVTEEMFGGMLAKKSNLYYSNNNGKSFSDITSQLGNGIIRKVNGLMKNAYFPDQAFVVLYNNEDPVTPHSDLYIKEIGSQTFAKVDNFPFLLEDTLVFHKKNQNYILGQSISQKKLYITKDGGKTWTMIHEKVLKFSWHDDMDDPQRTGTIYVIYDPDLVPSYMWGQVLSNNDGKLMRSDDFGATWQQIMNHAFTFGVQGHFIFVSCIDTNDPSKRIMRTSTNVGNSWNEAQLPSITADRFYSVLDMTEGVVFMHVDNPGNTGHGTLYVSDAKGIIFSESLQRHLYPNYQDVTDFYKVQSIQGVYLASKLAEDNSVHTVITYDRGAKWQPIPRPAGVACVDESKDCYLQIHNLYSISQNVQAQTPLSTPTATGIIMVHAHVASALQTKPPDVFVSNDGGYSWYLSLNGPHHYQIADHGGLLVAVPSVQTPKVVKFSTDEGRCWHEYQFNDKDDFILTGLLTEPGNAAMTVSIWGYGSIDHVWRIYVINFEIAVPLGCNDADYESWTAHQMIHGEQDENFKGCLLGAKVNYMRLKHDSWCHNGYPHKVQTTTEHCPCRKDDYECDYGYYRSDGSDDCVFDQDLKHGTFDICQHGHIEELVSHGYRKIPGDKCSGGFNPPAIKEIDIGKKCREGDKSIVVNEEKNPIAAIESLGGTTQGPTPSPAGSGVVAVVVILVIGIIVLMSVFFGRKCYLLRKNNVTYRYSSLHQSEEFDYDNDFENALSRHTSLYEDTSDDDLISNKSQHKKSYGLSENTKLANGAVGRLKKVKSYHDDSDVDMLE